MPTGELDHERIRLHQFKACLKRLPNANGYGRRICDYESVWRFRRLIQQFHSLSRKLPPRRTGQSPRSRVRRKRWNIGEGFDDARLDTLFLAMPNSRRGTLQQYVGRLQRLHDNKREVIVYDYVDDCVPALSAMFSKRVRGYEAVSYVIQDDACEELVEGRPEPPMELPNKMSGGGYVRVLTDAKDGPNSSALLPSLSRIA